MQIPPKESKCPDPLGAPLGYMESCRVFKPTLTSEYNLCCFYKVGLTGDFPEFPKPCKPETNDHVLCFLKKARALSQPNLIVEHSQDVVTAVCLLQELHAKGSLWHLKMEVPMEAAGKFKWKLSFCPFCQYLGSNDLSYLNCIICMHYNANYGCSKCLDGVFNMGMQLKQHMKGSKV